MNLTDKVALVTGGAVRVGRAIALGLAQEQVKLAVHYHGSAENAIETVEAIRSLGVEAEAFQGDFCEISSVNKVVSEARRRFGRLDFLINSAARYFQTPFGQVAAADWDALLDLNLRAPFFCAQAAAGSMKAQGSGKIINISDVTAMDPAPDFIPYSASKAGLIAITKGLAKALAPEIQVNAIASGTVLLQEDAPEEYRAKIAGQTLLKRIGNPEDIAKTVIFLLRDGDYITGEVISVDGGRLLA